jgi:hypothetical protein
MKTFYLRMSFKSTMTSIDGYHFSVTPLLSIQTGSPSVGVVVEEKDNERGQSKVRCSGRAIDKMMSMS